MHRFRCVQGDRGVAGLRPDEAIREAVTVVAGRTAISAGDFADKKRREQDRQNSKRKKRSCSVQKGGRLQEDVASDELLAEKENEAPASIGPLLRPARLRRPTIRHQTRPQTALCLNARLKGRTDANCALVAETEKTRRTPRLRSSVRVLRTSSNAGPCDCADSDRTDDSKRLLPDERSRRQA